MDVDLEPVPGPSVGPAVSPDSQFAGWEVGRMMEVMGMEKGFEGGGDSSEKEEEV